MGCGCNSNKNTAARPAAAAAAPQLYEVVNTASKQVVYRTRDQGVARTKGGREGFHYRRAGTSTPITD